jgi:hypothetical protein
VWRVKERGEYYVEILNFTIHGLQQIFFETWRGSELDRQGHAARMGEMKNAHKL